MSDVTRFPDPFGVGTAEAGALRSLPRPDPTALVWFWDDFTSFSGYTVTETQAGATQALVNGHGGQLALVNTNAENDLNQVQLTGEAFRFASGRRAWFETRLQVSNATQSDVYAGLMITGATPATTTDGVYFEKVDGATAVNFKFGKNIPVPSVPGTILNAVAAMADATWITLGFYFDGSAFSVFANDAPVGKVAAGDVLPDDEDVTVTLAVYAGDGNARTLTVDYVFVAFDR